ncbi:MAG: DUF5915 domain-containing protein, partial [Gammaproteobacteria bacterium]|nr:DUF5915 domain-containing protein [Gammaproteobacteria bacterium]
PKLGKEGHGRNLPAIRSALEQADGAAIARAAANGETFVIVIPDGELTLTAEDVLIETSSAEGYACAEDSGYLTALDTSLNEDLIKEGYARELVRSIQDARKQAGLEVSDRITLGVSGSKNVEEALLEHRDYVMSETLATNWQVGQEKPLYKADRELDDDHWTIEISR